jgi:dihydroorotase
MKETPFDLQERLSEHFTLGEMLQSGTAVRLKIENTPSADDVARMRALCRNVLEPLRKRFGALKVTSGYRCEALNNAVGGVKNSQHTKGEAADLHCASVEQALKMAYYVRDHLTFDQLLVERVMLNGCCWIHVSYVTETTGRKNRKMMRYVTV